MIAGILKNSFVDYPSEIAFVIFLGGCNLKCPFCHNKSVVLKRNETYEVVDVLKMLEERKSFTTAVVVSGGEPTLWDDKLVNLIKQIKNIGYKVKLDTNGTNPSVVKKLLDLELLDFIAMDIKNSFEKYDETSGAKVNIDKIKESIKLIENSKLDYQFRTTLNATMHTEEDIKIIKSYIKDKTKLKLQDYKYSKEQIVDKDFGIFKRSEI